MLINHTDINDEEKWVDIQDLGVELHSKTLPESPNISVVDTDNVNKRKIHLDTKFTHRDMEVQLAVVRHSQEELREVLTVLSWMVKGKFNLIFKDNKNQLYKDVLLTSRIEVEAVTSTVYILSFNMTSYDPFRYNTSMNSTEVTEVTEAVSVDIVNQGNFTAKPVVRLTGSAKQINISTNNKTLSYVNLEPGEEIIVDNDKYTIVRRANGVDQNALANWKDNFIELHSGTNELTITGDEMNANVTVEFRDTFL